MEKYEQIKAAKAIWDHRTKGRLNNTELPKVKIQKMLKHILTTLPASDLENDSMWDVIEQVCLKCQSLIKRKKDAQNSLRYSGS